MGDFARGDGTGPPRKKGGANASFMHVPLVPPEIAGGVPEGGIVAAFCVSTVVAGEKDQGFVVDAEIIEEGKDGTDLIVKVLHHSCEAGDGIDHVWARLVRPGSVFSNLGVEFREDLPPFVMEVSGSMHGGVGNGRGDVAKEGLFGRGMAVDKGPSLIHDEVIDEGSFLHGDFFAIVDEGRGEIGVGNSLAFPSIEFVKPMGQGVWGAFDVCFPETPFSKRSRRVSRETKELGEDEGFRGKRGSILTPRNISPEVAFPRVKPGHEDGAGGAADGVSRVVLGETKALRSQTIDVRRLQFFLAIAGEISVAEVVCEDVDDVGGGVSAEREEQEMEADEDSGRHAKGFRRA